MQGLWGVMPIGLRHPNSTFERGSRSEEHRSRGFSRKIGACALALSLASAGCSASLWEGVAQSVAQGAAATNTDAGTAAQPQYGSPKLMIFGGSGHATYLGCLNCPQYATDSVLNQYGVHGSRYQAESIFNTYGDYGSRFSDFSACNPYASDPPVIVDGNGGFYGRLTVNSNHPQATRSERWRAWVAGVCASR